MLSHTDQQQVRDEKAEYDELLVKLKSSQTKLDEFLVSESANYITSAEKSRLESQAVLTSETYTHLYALTEVLRQRIEAFR